MNMMRLSHRSAWIILSVVFSTLVAGCAARTNAPVAAGVPTSSSPTGPTGPTDTLASAHIQSAAPALAVSVSRPEAVAGVDTGRLQQLLQERASVAGEYPLGAGDVLEITVPAMAELQQRVVRIARVGSIELPFIGKIRAAGLTESELRQELRLRLQREYMHNPRLDLRVREYRSRQVAVIGAVARPGLYSLTAEVESLGDLVARAGGLTEKASSRLAFFPAQTVTDSVHAALLNPANVYNQQDLSGLWQDEPFTIDLHPSPANGMPLLVNLPARPGDVIFASSKGEVLVDGWVGQPGSYPITPGLTVLGAVTAAGGARFAADTSTVKLIRADKRGKKVVFMEDLERIKRGQGVDMLVQEGDVIEVAASRSKLVQYGVYRFFSSVFRVGASAALF